MTIEELVLKAIGEEIDKIVKEESDKILLRAMEEIERSLKKRIQELSAKVSFEIAKRFETDGHESIITVRYKP